MVPREHIKSVSDTETLFRKLSPRGRSVIGASLLTSLPFPCVGDSLPISIGVRLPYAYRRLYSDLMDLLARLLDGRLRFDADSFAVLPLPVLLLATESFPAFLSFTLTQDKQIAALL